MYSTFLKKLRSTTSSKKKQEILKQYCDNDYMHDMLLFALNPFLTFGVSDINIKVSGNKTLDFIMFEDFIEILGELYNRKLTGNAARETLVKFIQQFDKDDQDVLLCILQKDLKAGVSVKTVNKVFPDLIPEFNVQLADTLKSLSDLKFPVYLEPKLDGIRAVAIKHDNNVTIYSRTGKILEFPVIRKELQKFMKNDTVFDGEIYSNKGFQSLMKQVHRLKNAKKENFIYHVFDCLTYQEFINGHSDRTYVQRRDKLYLQFEKSRLFRDIVFKNVVIVSECMATKKSHVKEFYEQCLNDGYEGIMIKRPLGEYSGRRTKDWLKYKPVNTLDCVIDGFIEGTGKYKGMLGALEVIQSNGKTCGVGSGFNDEQRREIWQNRKKYKNKTIEIKYQEKTKDEIARFPVFIRMRPDLDE